MQVSDLTFRFKLLFLGFLSPVFLTLGLFFSSPYWLGTNDPYLKSDVAVLEMTEDLPTKKHLKNVATLYTKGDFKKLILVSREDKSQNKFFSPVEIDQKTKEILISNGIPGTQMQTVIISTSKMGDTDEASKNLLKIAVSDNLGSILLLTREFEKRRVLKIYKKTLTSLPVKVTAYGFPSEVSASNWFLSESGVKEISVELVRYIYSYTRGIL
ncbi:Hypothetical protein LBF_1841 [Leptospira biflexa serovar Patoc strain 'Patoc 1 (Ames)']|uniref:DUF218 domain-containing protein n=1 Tax=Leptospira biflexa serovar Patoc (strain Patoc 1 / ATCC 23582 / Paris) TaxID=456481 RepID=B0SSA9_LEPBP|nr:hypothetical protein [Leptospira biflexa]ABZ94347.1 Hypothetical protein LBF_1841 [Leptospira biflexa serovar Patoc strain 'Patoc 1 (Ames)']ABZ97999.1 Conserved hypothetical protein; putative signal peptide [Leptospira biflexa serovar Patoc strain 'Patoc 1 (Paris)']